MLTTFRPPRIIQNDLGRDEMIVSLPERLDIHQVASLHVVLRSLELRPNDRVSLDGSVVEHTDAAGIEFLADAQSFCDGVGVRLALTNTSLALRLAIELTDAAGMPSDRSTDVLADFAPMAA